MSVSLSEVVPAVQDGLLAEGGEAVPVGGQSFHPAQGKRRLDMYVVIDFAKISHLSYESSRPQF